jgi:transcription initiation factor IIE alpha subunit
MPATDQIQLEFKCPRCRLAGLTPELDQDAARSLTLGAVRLPCPKCGAVLEILDSLPGVVRRLSLLRASHLNQAVLKEMVEGLLEKRKAMEAKSEERRRDE